MKNFGKILSACALILTGVWCHGAEHHQKIYIKNTSKSTIRGGVYPTTISGKVMNALSEKVQTMSRSMAPGACRTIIISKPKNLKATQYHRLIFAKDVLDANGRVITEAEDVIRAKVNNNVDNGVYSTIIKQFTEDKPLHYIVYDGVTTITRKPNLKFKKGSFTCNAIEEGLGNISGIALETGGTIKRWVKKTGESLSEAWNEGVAKEETDVATPLPTPRKKDPRVEEIRARQAARQ